MSEPTRTYRHEDKGDVLIVEWHKDKCVHCQLCINGLPKVFNMEARPWVDLSKATHEEIRNQVNQCPDGALALGKE